MLKPSITGMLASYAGIHSRDYTARPIEHGPDAQWYRGIIHILTIALFFLPPCLKVIQTTSFRSSKYYAEVLFGHNEPSEVISPPAINKCPYTTLWKIRACGFGTAAQAIVALRTRTHQIAHHWYTG